MNLMFDVHFQVVALQAVMAALLGGDTIHHALGIPCFGRKQTGDGIVTRTGSGPGSGTGTGAATGTGTKTLPILCTSTPGLFLNVY